MEHPGSWWRRPSALVLGAATLVTLELVVSHARFVPLWDGRFYAECVIEAAKNGLRPYWLRCAGHPSQAYVRLAGLARWLAPNGTLSFVVVGSGRVDGDIRSRAAALERVVFCAAESGFQGRAPEGLDDVRSGP